VRFHSAAFTIKLSRSEKIGLLLAAVAAFCMWFYVQHVLVPHQESDAAIHGRPRGNLSDLYPRWLGARELLLHHRDPYSAEVTREIQAGYYGRVLDPARPEDPKDQQAFAYPVYVVFLLAPTVNFSFDNLQVWFRPFLVILIVGTVLLWLRAIEWSPPPGSVAILILLTLGSFAALQAIKLQQLTVVVSALLAGSIALVVSGHLLSAGILLALAIIKPQLALPLAGWLTLWSLSDWRTRWRFLAGFAASMAALAGGAQWILPGWLSRFHAAVAAYREYTGGGKSLLDVLLPMPVAHGITLVLVVAVLLICWRARLKTQQESEFALTTAVVVATTVVVIPTFAPYNQLLLLPGVFLLIRARHSLWQKKWPLRWAYVIAGFVVIWPWIAALTLLLASIVLSPQLVERAWTLPLFTSLAIPVAVCGLLIPLALDAAPGLSSR
jgi:hypothetical protein